MVPNGYSDKRILHSDSKYISEGFNSLRLYIESGFLYSPYFTPYTPQSLNKIISDFTYSFNLSKHSAALTWSQLTHLQIPLEI